MLIFGMVYDCYVLSSNFMRFPVLFICMLFLYTPLRPRNSQQLLGCFAVRFFSSTPCLPYLANPSHPIHCRLFPSRSLPYFPRPFALPASPRSRAKWLLLGLSYPPLSRSAPPFLPDDGDGEGNPSKWVNILSPEVRKACLFVTEFRG